MAVSFTYDVAGANQLLKVELLPPVMLRAAERTAMRAQANLSADGRINSGALAASIVPSPLIIGSSFISISIGSPLFYAIYQEIGVGPIYPVRANALRFKPKGSSVFIFRKSTSGIPPSLYLTRALAELSNADFVV